MEIGFISSILVWPIAIAANLSTMMPMKVSKSEAWQRFFVAPCASDHKSRGVVGFEETIKSMPAMERKSFSLNPDRFCVNHVIVSHPDAQLENANAEFISRIVVSG